MERILLMLEEEKNQDAKLPLFRRSPRIHKAPGDF
jgi:hypothetical protein